MEYGREIVDGFASRGELPIPLRGAPGAAVGRGQGGLELTCDGFVSGENGQQSEQELEQGRRKMDAIHRPRQAAKGVGFERSGDGMWHHR
jgi:hypothetical protein